MSASRRLERRSQKQLGAKQALQQLGSALQQLQAVGVGQLPGVLHQIEVHFKELSTLVQQLGEEQRSLEDRVKRLEDRLLQGGDQTHG